MSKQSEAKTAQNWRKEPNTCSRCAHFKMDVVEQRYEGFSGTQIWSVDKNLRCSLGGFKTAKTAVCDRFEPKAVSVS